MVETKFFNTAGPCNAQNHYMIDAMRGLDKEILSLIKDAQFFVIHAARQSGKTTLLRALAAHINAGGVYYAVYCSLENLSSYADADRGIPIVIEDIQNSLRRYKLPGASSFASGAGSNSSANALQIALETYCESLEKPLVLLLDESDCLCGETLITFLRQLRSGYGYRSETPFVHSLALVGMRDIRDYKNDIRDPSDTLGSGSPFNISTESMTLKNFTREEIANLYAQHTADTGQVFLDEAINLVWEQTQGQPWLVNAIARIIVKNTADAPQTPVTADMVADAIQTLILRWDTHFDSLMARLEEDRVKRIIEPIIIGEEGAIKRDSLDYRYVKDMGLIRDDRGYAEPANLIYGEIIIRTLSRDSQDEINLKSDEYPIPRYIKGDAIDMGILLRDFQSFWRENAEIWQEKYDYKEAAPHLILQAFLQRVVNGGGRIIREMAAGKGRTDLCVIYNEHTYPIELKIRRDTKTYAKAVEQTTKYMDKYGCADGWLVIFDQRNTPSWDDRLFVNTETVGDKTVIVYGC